MYYLACPKPNDITQRSLNLMDMLVGTSKLDSTGLTLRISHPGLNSGRLTYTCAYEDDKSIRVHTQLHKHISSPHLNCACSSHWPNKYTRLSPESRTGIYTLYLKGGREVRAGTHHSIYENIWCDSTYQRVYRTAFFPYTWAEYSHNFSGCRCHHWRFLLALLVSVKWYLCYLYFFK